MPEVRAVGWKQRIRAAIPVAVGLLAVLLLLLLVAGRHRLVVSECRYCARQRHQRWWAFIEVEDRAEASRQTELVTRLAPEHTCHAWETVTYETRGWFGGGFNVDGWWAGSAMLSLIARAEKEFGTETARAYLLEYFDILDRGSPGGEAYDLRRSLEAQVDIGILTVGPARPPYPTNRAAPRPHSEVVDIMLLALMVAMGLLFTGLVWGMNRLLGVRREPVAGPRVEDQWWAWFFLPAGTLFAIGATVSTIIEGRITYSVLFGSFAALCTHQSIRHWPFGRQAPPADDDGNDGEA